MGLARVSKFRLYQVGVLYYPGSEQQRRWSDCADVVVRIWHKHVFSWHGLNNSNESDKQNKCRCWFLLTRFFCKVRMKLLFLTFHILFKMSIAPYIYDAVRYTKRLVKRICSIFKITEMTLKPSRSSSTMLTWTSTRAFKLGDPLFPHTVFE